jgi:2-polyprenyl-6-methoxyphenol hydroxylase-like FAD-dependent oxidoreductase
VHLAGIMARENLKIVIVGGSVTGLILANILERFDIDYVLLESHEQVAPQLGASIAFWSNGLRILDQLGCLDDYCKDTIAPETGTLTLEGKLTGLFHGFTRQHVKRYGWSVKHSLNVC